MALSVSVVGGSGYAGAELVGLLARHPDVRLASVHADASAGQRFGDLHPGKRHLYEGMLLPLDPGALAGRDVVFLALPHGASAAAARALHGRVGRIVDLSGDLRLADAAEYRTWYGGDHPAPELLGQAVYGLPELFAAGLEKARLVACAGCYATVVQLAAAPALALGDRVGGDVVASAMSGTSGAGRKSDLALSFSEVSASLKAYRVGRHQHVPEIVAGLDRHASRRVRLTFVPHLVPIARGILATVVLPNPGGVTGAELLAAYRAAYADAPFVRVLDPSGRLPEVGDVVGTNFCDLAPAVDAGASTIVVVAVLDNLMKGAAGQAVQVMNIACGLPETAGLTDGAGCPRTTTSPSPRASAAPGTAVREHGACPVRA